MRAAVNDMLEHLQYATLHFCGFEVLPPYAVYGADNASREQQERILNQFRQIIATLEAIPPMAYR
jgi:NAD(P)H dehydrogenase (quinone)